MSIWTRHGLSFTSEGESSTPKEHLDVLVLNGAKYFIDLRVKLNSSIHLDQDSKDAKGKGTASDLDWGFSGTRLEGPRGEGEGGSTYCKWSTTICSRSPPPQEILLDEGNLFFDSNNPLIFYERGIMTNPFTGIGQPGEEVWHSIPRKDNERMIFLEREDGGGLISLFGKHSLGVGRKGQGGKGDIYIWRRSQGELKYWLGESEGVDIIENVEKDLEQHFEVGEIVQDVEGRNWIVREYEV